MNNELKKTYEKLAKWEDALCIELSNGDKSILVADQQLLLHAGR